MPRCRTLFVLLCMLALLLLISYLSFTSLEPSASHRHATSSFLFPASAVISLTDDNSTFFISRSAAFGPALPKLGMDGELFVLDDGQLACDDTPGWDPSSAVLVPTALPAPLKPGEVDDGTDDLLNPPVHTAASSTGDGRRHPAAKVAPASGHADIQTLQQSAEISGKIVLVQRGGCGFLEKVLWTQRRGGVALIVGDYQRSGGGGAGGLVTMYAKGDTSNVTIPSLFTSHTTAKLLTTLLPNPQKPLAMAHEASSASDSADSRRPPESGELSLPPRSPEALRSIDTSPPVGRHEGLWITLTPTSMSSSPFFDTLLVLVVSPLVTLTIVYTLLLIRSRIRRRRWRAPKSVVERLPVRTYQSIPTPSATPTRASFPPRSSSLRPEQTGGRARTPSSRSPEKTPPLSPQPQQQPRCDGRCHPHHPRRQPYLSGSNECVVCLEEYVDGVSQVMKLPCGHEFHVGCITPWLTTRRRTCPICKGDVVRGASSMCSGPDLEACTTSGEGSDERTPLVFENEHDEHERDHERDHSDSEDMHLDLGLGRSR